MVMKHIKLFEQFEQELNEAAVTPATPVLVPDGNGKLRWNISQGTMFRAIRKLVSDMGKKALERAYTDDADIVNNKTSKTILSVKPGMTIGQIAKVVDAWADQNAKMFAAKNKSVADSETIEIKSETRAIIATDAETAKAIKSGVHNSKQGINVRIMDRKDGAKVYIDTESKEALSAAVAKAKSILG